MMRAIYKTRLVYTVVAGLSGRIWFGLIVVMTELSWN